MAELTRSKKKVKITKCMAEKVGLCIGSTIILLAGTKELVCKNCTLKCPYKLLGQS